MNDLAVEALGGAVPAAELAPGLRALVAAGLARRGEGLVFADRDDAVPRDGADLTGWECSVNAFHLDAVVPVRVGRSADGEPVIGEADQVLMLRHGWGFALEVVRLVRELAGPVPVRCIVGANSTNGTFRFHRVRPGESWLGPDLDAYSSEKLIVVDHGSPRLR
ncbi:hypothetical protein AB0425_41630 [Actinosynnema sp. NPDC051121]